MNILFIERRLFCCLLFLIAACGGSRTGNQESSCEDSMATSKEADAFYNIAALKKTVKNGDLVLRTGRDFTSEVFRHLSTKDRTYSHCGIASLENDSLFVYHVIGGEWNPDHKMRRDPFEVFCNPYESRGIGIYRYRLDELQQHNLLKTVKDFYKQEVRFDMQFDLLSDEQMYCTELVYKSLSYAMLDSIGLPLTTMNGIEFVAVDNLFINPVCEKIKTADFEVTAAMPK